MSVNCVHNMVSYIICNKIIDFNDIAMLCLNSKIHFKLITIKKIIRFY